MKILVTGATGYVGKHLVLHLSKLKFNVITASKNSFSQVLNLHRDVKFDYIIHLAVKTEAGGYCQNHPGEQFLINQQINTEMLWFWKTYQPQAKMITFGSSCGYDKNIIKTENNYLKGEPEPGYEVYGNIKRNLLIGLEAFNKEYGMDYSYLIPSVFYGPGYNLNDKHFIFDLIRKIYNGKNKGEKVVLWGNGKQKRELIYIDDAINIIMDSLTWKHKISNLSSGREYFLEDYALMICEIMGYDYNLIEWDTNAFVGSTNKHLVNTNLQHYNFIHPYDGLKETIKYYEDRISNSISK